MEPQAKCLTKIFMARYPDTYCRGSHHAADLPIIPQDPWSSPYPDDQGKRAALIFMMRHDMSRANGKIIFKRTKHSRSTNKSRATGRESYHLLVIFYRIHRDLYYPLSIPEFSFIKEISCNFSRYASSLACTPYIIDLDIDLNVGMPMLEPIRQDFFCWYHLSSIDRPIYV